MLAQPCSWSRLAKVSEEPFIRQVAIVASRVPDAGAFPFTLPAVQALDGLRIAPVTYFVGENGSGKSTILEAIAIAAGFNAEGGGRNFTFSTRRSESGLADCLRLIRTERRPRTGFFLRAESYFNLATNIEELDRVPAAAPPIIDSYGGRSLHEQSHGESFLALLAHRFTDGGLYVLDEPEAALSPKHQLVLLQRIGELARAGSQFIIATHAPIVLAHPGATLYHLDARGITQIAYDDAEPVTVTRGFFADGARGLPLTLDTSLDRAESLPGDSRPAIDDKTWLAIRSAWRGGK